MARDNRVRLADDEQRAVEEVREQRYDEDVAENVPLGKVIGDLAKEELEGEDR